jgi:hypothetical protein
MEETVPKNYCLHLHLSPLYPRFSRPVSLRPPPTTRGSSPLVETIPMRSSPDANTSILQLTGPIHPPNRHAPQAGSEKSTRAEYISSSFMRVSQSRTSSQRAEQLSITQVNPTFMMSKCCLLRRDSAYAIGLGRDIERLKRGPVLSPVCWPTHLINHQHSASHW